MPSINSWTQLSPQMQDENMAAALQAKIHDPLWLMARQWQFGEFKGEDAGSPVTVRFHGEGMPLNRYYPGIDPAESPMQSQPWNQLATPLETLVEGEYDLVSSSVQYNWRAAAEAGMHFCRLLKQQGAGRYVDAFRFYFPMEDPDLDPASLDPDTARFLGVMQGRVPDGFKLYSAMFGLEDGIVPPKPVISDKDKTRVAEAIQRWLTWFRKQFALNSPQRSSWKPERMEYAFGVSAATSTKENLLTASEYHGGRLDWYAFDLYTGGNSGTATNTTSPATINQTTIPTAVGFKGMPAGRWWEFEDGQVNFGSFDAEPTDLIRLVFMEFALTYGNDWFVMPLALDKGAIYSAQALIVTDTFGRASLIRPYHEVDGPDAPWRMFSLAEDRLHPGNPAIPPEALFFVPPSLAGSLESKPVEELRLLRDEMANLAWAVEHQVENGLGRALNRHEAFHRKRYAAQQEDASTEKTDTPAYHLMTEVPDHWIPLVPTRLSAQNQEIRLRRGQLLHDDSGNAVSPGPEGKLLLESSPLDIFEEEVPRAGAHVLRQYQYARWIGGSNHLWLGRRKRTGRGEGWSGLRFDALEDYH